MSFDLKYNSVVIGANIDAVIQKDSSSGLGNVWSESLGQWTTIAGNAYADITHSVTEAPEHSGVAYAEVIDFDTNYTGRLVVGYYDGAVADPDAGGYIANTKPLFSEVRYVRNGHEVSFTLAQDRANMPIATPFIFKMSRRADGTVVALESIYMSDVDVKEFGFDIDVLVPEGTVVSEISNIAVSPAGSLGVNLVGPRDQIAMLKTDGAQVAGTPYTISCDVLTSNSETFELVGTIVCVATI